MTICRFYTNGYCRYGNSCRFEHINNSRDYYQKNYNRSDGRPNQSTNTSNRSTGFSFNRTLDTISSNKGFGQQMPFGGQSSNFRLRDSQMSENNSIQSNPRPGNFSFNRTLQQISNNERPSSRPIIGYDDIDMDSMGVSRMGANTGSHMMSHSSHPMQANSFGHFSQTNNSNLFGNKSIVSQQNQNQFIANTNTSFDSKPNSDQKFNDFYSKITDLNESQKKEFESNVFTYKSIPVCPPPQSLCF